MGIAQSLPKAWKDILKNKNDINSIIERSTNMKMYYGGVEALFGDANIGIVDVINKMETHSVAHIVVEYGNKGLIPPGFHAGGTLIITKLNPYRVDLKFIGDVDSPNLRIFDGAYHANNGFTGWKEVFTDSSCKISKSENGWVRFANGLIIQWGRAGEYRQTEVNVSLPLSFSNTEFKFYATGRGQNTAPFYYLPVIAIHILNSSLVWANLKNISSVTNEAEVSGMCWLAIGY